MSDLYAFMRQELAVTSIEYALCAALIAAVIFVAVGSVGSVLGSFYGYVSDCVSAAAGGSFAGC